jgi:hypothetical protein
MRTTIAGFIAVTFEDVFECLHFDNILLRNGIPFFFLLLDNKVFKRTGLVLGGFLHFRASFIFVRKLAALMH